MKTPKPIDPRSIKNKTEDERAAQQAKFVEEQERLAEMDKRRRQERDLNNR